MVDVVEATGDVSSNEPCGARPGAGYLREGRVASTVGPEAVRPVAELRFVVRLQQETHHFLQYLVRPRGESEWPPLPVGFRDVYAAGRSPSVALEAKGLDDRVDVVHLCPVCGLRRCAWGERAVVLGDAPVGHQVQVRVPELAVKVIHGQSPCTSVANDSQYGFGVAHLAHLLF